MLDVSGWFSLLFLTWLAGPAAALYLALRLNGRR